MPRVLSAAGDGAAASLVLGLALAAAGALYVFALLRPPQRAIWLVAAVAALIASTAAPVLFSADVFAYAYYGDLLLHGHDPYAHDPALLDDALARAAARAWDGHLPPRCVYGPLAVGIAALGDLAGAPFGAGGAIAAQRIIAAAAGTVCIATALRLFRDERARIAFAAHPVVLWSCAEGHNDAAMLALVFAALLAPRARALLVAAAVLVKAPALLLVSTLRRERASAVALAAAALGYVPLLAAVVAGGAAFTGAGHATAWESPLGLAAAAVGRPAALVLAVTALAALAVALRRVPGPERTAALAFAAWFALPNAYPWYALWIVPLAARDLRSPWSRALLVAALAAPARAATDAMFPNGGTLHGAMIGLEYLPPLAFRLIDGLRRPASALAATALVFAACTAGAPAQTATPAPSPVPAATPAGPPVPLGLPPPPPPPTPTPTLAPTPAASATPSPAPAGSTAPASSPSPAASPNGFGYVITPAAEPAAAADGPHIVEVAVNDRTIHPGGPLVVRVTTSANVVGVEARALGRFIAIPRSGPATFALQYTMPGGIPFWLLNKNYDIVIAAATADGRQTTVNVPMLLAR